MPTLLEVMKLHEDISKLSEDEKLEKLIKLINDLTRRIEYLEFRNGCVDRR